MKQLSRVIALLWTISVVSSILQSQDDTPKTELKLVQILFRHGDRSPVMNYPNDPYKESTWDKYGGFGQLTQTGMKQHFYFGKFLRNYYADFLNQFYNRENVHIVSTDFDRTLMSAYSLLNGIFSPVDYQVWNENVTWQPIPVHTTDKSNDKIFYGQSCPRLDQLRKQVKKSDEYLRVNQQYQHLFDVIDKNSGCLENSSCAHMNIDDEWRITDCLFVEATHNLTLPDWVLPIYDKLQESKGWGFYFSNHLTEMAKLQAGGILKDMLINVKNKIKNDKSRDQIRLYSGHDTYIAAMSKLLNITNYINQPSYASAVALELRKDINSEKYYIQAFLKNNTAIEAINYNEMLINGCERLCPLEKFIEMTKDLVINDYAKECETKSAEVNHMTQLQSKNIYDIITSLQRYTITIYDKNFTGFMVIVCLIFIATVFISIAIVKKAQAYKQASYIQINNDEFLRGV